MAKRGRKKIEIDKKEVEKLAGLGCTVEEIAEFLGVSKRTLERNFVAAINKGREHVKISLKKKQFDVAMKGNVSMLIWLGKNYLGQKDKVDASGNISVVVKSMIMEKK